MFPRLLSVGAAAIALSISHRVAAEDPGRVAWSNDWPRFRPAEVALTAGLALGVAAALFVYPEPKANWTGGILFDDATRDALRLTSRDARAQTAKVSDYVYYALATYPLLVDVGIVAWGVHGAGDVAFQMLLIDLESYAFTGAIALTAEKIGRVRPLAQECARDAEYDEKCGRAADLNASFLSGHTTIAFAGAGLLCAHHQHLPLYGGGAADTLACVLGLTAASAAGTLRVMSDNHYASDVLLGAGIGLFGGYVLPALLHYGFRAGEKRVESFLPRLRIGSDGNALTGALVPHVGPTGAGVSLVIASSPARGSI